MEIIREEQSFCWCYWFCILFAIICFSPLVIQQLPAPPSALPTYPFLSLIFLISQTNPGGRWKVCYAFYKALLRHFVCVCVCVRVLSANSSRRIFIGCQGIKSDSNWSRSLPKRFTKCFRLCFFCFVFIFSALILGTFRLALDGCKNFCLGIS